MDSFEYHGYWRLPNNTRTIAGTLKFSPTHGGTLELLGSFEEIGGISNANAIKHEIIHGYTQTGSTSLYINALIFTLLLASQVILPRSSTCMSYLSAYSLILRRKLLLKTSQ